MTTITTLNLRHGGGSRADKIIATLSTLTSDIIVLTEFRNNEYGETIKHALTKFGFTNFYQTNAIAKLNTVLIACRQPFQTEVFPELANHSQRVVKISSDSFTLLGTYFPGKDDKKYVFDFLLKYINDHPNEKIIITGDINTGKHYLDENGATFFHSNYLDKFEQLGYIDAWRYIHGNKKEYTWYSNAGNGFRLDHFFVHGTLKSKIKNCFYNHETRINKVTDHSMMTIEID